MARFVADTSALVSLGTVVSHEENPLDVLLDEYDVSVPEQVESELQETARYEDPSGTAARAVLDRLSELTVHATELDESFPLDDGENAVVTLAITLDATHVLCDEFNQLAIVHASLADTRLVTTPTLLLVLVRNGLLAPADAVDCLTKVSEARSWETNAYVARSKATLQRELDSAIDHR